MAEAALWFPNPSGSLTVSDDGCLLLAGRRADELLREFGSPLVLINEDVVRHNCRDYQKRAAVYPRSRVYYASKALMNKAIARIMDQEGMGIDVVSRGELATALAAGFPAERLLMHGNAKGMAEIEMAIEAGVGRIVLDNFADIEAIEDIAAAKGKPVKTMIRVAPGVKPSTHAYVQTGQEDSKFGFNIAGGHADEALKRIKECNSIELVGIHCHIGSQILDLRAFEAAAEAMLGFYAHCQREYGLPLDELNLGGGLGVQYSEEMDAPTIEQHMNALAKSVLGICQQKGIEPPVICDEPGRTIMGNAGVTLYTVQSIKQVPGVRNYVGIDGGITDNPRFALYGSYHQAVLANRMQDAHDEEWAIAGKCCESGDMLSLDAKLPQPQRGDIIAMFTTGAYTFSMASNYNRVAKPAVVLAGTNGFSVISRRETDEDVMHLDVLPEWLT